MKIFKKLLMVVLCFSFVLSATACGEKNQFKGTPVSLLTTGWVNSPPAGEDPYRKWVDDNYGLNVNLITTNDFLGQATIKFAGNDKPDIVAFPDLNSFRTIKEQGVLIDDWTPYLDKMPNVAKVINKKDADRPNDKSIAQKMFSDGDKLSTLWTLPNPPTWSMKIREDWANEFRATPDGVNWNPLTEQDLLSFARWIKATKPGCYAFTSAGSRKDFGTLGTWLPLMWGPVDILPYGIYINDQEQPDFGVLDGNHKKMLDYLKTIIDEGLIDPQWYDQTWNDKTKTKEGKIGIEWYPGAISQESEDFKKKDEPTTVDWWKTYNVPKATTDTVGMGGLMPIEGYVGQIITVSKKATLDKDKMDKICKLLNDVAFYYDETAEGTAKYVRGKAYDALRWGVGVEEGIAYSNIEGTSYNYLNTGDSDTKKYYRNTQNGSGAWDWGAWFSTTGDGVIQGTTATITPITQKVIEHNLATAAMPTRVQLGASLNLDSAKIKDMTARTLNYEYKYVKGQNTGFADYDAFKAKWRGDFGGDKIMLDATKQLIELGLINALN